ncbi:MAG: hypothetical protein IKT31_06160, partial [Firmicutes bacterium]|nr:hypothetical protein [Bacillota bacterium]
RSDFFHFKHPPLLVVSYHNYDNFSRSTACVKSVTTDGCTPFCIIVKYKLEYALLHVPVRLMLQRLS